MYTDDDSEDDDYRTASLIVVERRHYAAASEILKKAELGNAAFITAQERRDECRAGGDEAGAAFWAEVWNYLMHRASAAEGAQTVILEEGEEWDAENEKVIRPGKDRPRRNKGS